MLLIETVKHLKIASSRNSRYDGKPTLFAMIVCDTTGHANEIEFSDLAEAQSFVDAINKLIKN
jgi:hypothetical protein